MPNPASPSPASPVSMELPEEIERAIEDLMRQSRGWYCAPEANEVVQAREALTAAILSRLTAVEAERDEALARVERLEGALEAIERMISSRAKVFGVAISDGAVLAKARAALSSPAPTEEG